jgi:hypothetical protein
MDLVDVPSDGLCFFHCISKELGDVSALEIRERIADDLMTIPDCYCLNGESFSQLTEGFTRSEYVKMMRSGEIWPGHLEAKLVSERYKIRIKIFSKSRSVFLAYDSGPRMSRIVRLVHDGNHFMLIRTGKS